MKKPYQLLAKFYDKEEWGKYSLQYLEIINILKTKYDISFNTILDISCGTGDLIHELSKEYKVVGSDISEEMINVAKNKYPKMTFILSDMANLKLLNRFDLIISPFDSINYLAERNHLKRAFLNINNLLNKGGHFIFDFNTEKLFEDKHHGVFDKNTCGVSYKQICEYDKETKTAKTIFDFGGDEKEIHIQKAINYDEIDELLNECGFKIKYSHDIFKDESINENSYKIIILAGITDGIGV